RSTVPVRYLLSPSPSDPRRASLTATVTGPPPGSTPPVQPAGSELERPGPRRRSLPRHRVRPSWSISIVGPRKASLPRRRNRPRGGAAPEAGAVTALGETQRSGGRHWIGRLAV